MRKIQTYFIVFITFLSCKSQEYKKHIFKCNNKEISVFLPKIIKTQKKDYTEGKLEFLTTIDSVFIEFHCGGNYSSIISDTLRYKVLLNKGNSKRGVNITSRKFWRKEGKLSYLNCKAKDTAYYNRIFNNLKLKENK